MTAETPARPRLRRAAPIPGLLARDVPQIVPPTSIRLPDVTNILLTGATGFIGSPLCESLRSAGHRLTALCRNPEAAKRRIPALETCYEWEATSSSLPSAAFQKVDAVVNLAGEGVACRWTAARKRAIHDSRVLGTRHLVAGMEAADSKPKLLISASAIGYYGDRGEETLTEEVSPSGDFLAKLSVDWEEEAARAEALGVRVSRLRIGIVLGADGGALGAMMLPFKLGLGGPLGSGRQWWSWIHLADLIGIIEFLLDRELNGPFNATAPEPVRQKEFARTLGKVVRRPALLPAPSFALSLVVGEFSTELLSSKRVLPHEVQKAGYEFRFPKLERALREIVS